MDLTEEDKEVQYTLLCEYCARVCHIVYLPAWEKYMHRRHKLTRDLVPCEASDLRKLHEGTKNGS